VAQLAQMCDTHVLKEMHKFNLHEFTVMVMYYLNRDEICSRELRDALIAKIQDTITSFNEYQLLVLIKIISGLKEKYEDPARSRREINMDQLDTTLLSLNEELEQLQEEKVLMAAEDKIREAIRARLAKIKKDPTATLNKEEIKKKLYKLRGTKADQKLDQRI
jgi:hypothetical protein